jgi:hypothetical protein
MAVKRLFCEADGLNTIYSCTVNQSHSSPTANAIIECDSVDKDLGDEVVIDLGYDDNHGVILTGYIKMIEHKVPDGRYTVTIFDKTVRLSDYFIASSSPANPLSYRNIKAEDLIGNLVALAGIDDYNGQASYFTFGINNKFEVNLTSAYDYIRMISDVLTYHIYCDANGVIQFANRKPYVMYGTSGQPGDIADVAFATIFDSTGTGDRPILEFNYSKDETNLRNRVVVYGAGSVYAEAKITSPYLPNNPDGSPFYKSTVVASAAIDSNSVAQMSADYNLNLYNRLSYGISCSIEGDYRFNAHKVINVDEKYIVVGGMWYIYSATHTWGVTGYTTTLELRK